MKSRKVLLALIAATGVLIVTAPLASAASPKIIMMRFARAFNAGDLGGVAEVIADDITHRDPDGAMFNGKAAFLEHLKPEFAADAHITLSRMDTHGDTGVDGEFTLTSDDVRSTGVRRVAGRFDADVEGDKISRLDVEFDPTDDQTEQFLAAIQAAAPEGPSRLPATGDGSASREGSGASLLAGLAVAVGLGAVARWAHRSRALG